MYGMEEQQLTFDEGGSPIAKAEVILTDLDGKEYRLILENTPQRPITAQLSTRRLVDAPDGYLVAVRQWKGMATATIHLTGIVKENHDA